MVMTGCTGKLYGVGDNSLGQLGLTHNQCIPKPMQLNFPGPYMGNAYGQASFSDSCGSNNVTGSAVDRSGANCTNGTSNNNNGSCSTGSCPTGNSRNNSRGNQGANGCASCNGPCAGTCNNRQGYGSNAAYKANNLSSFGNNQVSNWKTFNSFGSCGCGGRGCSSCCNSWYQGTWHERSNYPVIFDQDCINPSSCCNNGCGPSGRNRPRNPAYETAAKVSQNAYLSNYRTGYSRY